MLSNSSKILHEYEIGTEFRGYAAKMTEEWVYIHVEVFFLYIAYICNE